MTRILITTKDCGNMLNKKFCYLFVLTTKTFHRPTKDNF